MRKWVVLSSSLTPVLPVAAWSLAQSRQPPGYDPVHQTISVLSERGAADRWVMSAGLLLFGACYLVTALGLTEGGRPGRVLLAAGGVATSLTAVFPQPEPEHVIAAGVAFLALTLWPLFALVPGSGGRVTATVVLLSLMAWFVIEIRGGTMLGLSERVLAAGEALWPLIVVISLLTGSKHDVEFHPGPGVGGQAAVGGRVIGPEPLEILDQGLLHPEYAVPVEQFITTDEDVRHECATSR